MTTPVPELPTTRPAGCQFDPPSELAGLRPLTRIDPAAVRVREDSNIHGAHELPVTWNQEHVSRHPEAGQGRGGG